jgi:hypothetical protein
MTGAARLAAPKRSRTSKSAPPAPVESPVLVQGSVQFDMASKISGRTYRVFVFKPWSSPPPSGYPVVTVTDGNMTFPLAATMAAGFALSGRPALVVGVGYPADDPLTPYVLRTRDMTPETPLSGIMRNPGQPPAKLEDYGGAEAFYRFLVEELRPAIAAAYPVDADDQTLYGHSLGGLFTLGVLFRHPESFRGFVASSPSIWWNKRAILKDEAGFAAKVAAGQVAPRVLITVGADEQDMPDMLPPGMTRAQTRKLMTQARMVDNARELAGRLAQIKGRPGYVIRFNAFAEEDHLTVVAASLVRALTFALRNADKSRR